MYFAHSSNRSGSAPEPYPDHVLPVAARAERYARPFGAESDARVAALLHDLGKWSPVFDRRLKGLESRLDHWTPGALAARKRFGSDGIVAALCILGHHAGLPDAPLRDLLKSAVENHSGYPSESKVTIKTSRDLAAIDAAIAEAAQHGVVLPDSFKSSFDRSLNPLARMLDVRMLFSALVDADFIETEAWFDGDAHGNRKYRSEGPALEPSRALEILLAHVAKLGASPHEQGVANERILGIRRELLDACLTASSSRTGLFDLTAPTGAGKTLAMLAFALKHAAVHDLRRVIVVIPFLSIIEQTARVYREIFEPHFGPCYVLEQHSLAGTREAASGVSDSEHEARRLRDQLAENWDAPLVITTSVQAIESLFAHRPAPCRKLHRLAKSVILFDEVQTLPAKWAVPILGSLAHLTTPRYGTTVVFSTATQPAFQALSARVAQCSGTAWNPEEIVKSAPGMFARATRAKIDVSLVRARAKTRWDHLAEELAREENSQALCIVNLKRHALRLLRLLRGRVERLFHLSTSMCPAHRRAVLAEVGEALRHGRPCRLIATQCVEAGVDVDFPRVWRALGPLEAILQAAGRCNRHGSRPEEGHVRVFEPEQDEEEKSIYPPGYDAAANEAASTIRGLANDFLDPADLTLIARYYTNLYDSGKAAPAEDFTHAVTGEHFGQVAGQLRLIDQETINVLVPYDRGEFTKLRDEALKLRSITRGWVQRARPYTVGVILRGNDRERLQPFLLPFKIQSEESDWWYLAPQGEEHYSGELGLTPPDRMPYLAI